jgi:arsenate reductase
MKILFMCVANSARSQLAEGVAKQIFGDRVNIASAGSQPATVNPFAVRALNEVGAQVSALYSKSVHDLPQDFIEKLDYVITLCAEEVCPVLLSQAKKLHWPLPDPAGHPGNDDEQMTRFRQTRDEIRRRIGEFEKSLVHNVEVE